MPAPVVFFVVNAIGGTAIRFGAKKAAQEFIKKYGGKLATKSGNRKVLSSAASGVKRWVQNLLKKKVDPKVKPGGRSGQLKKNKKLSEADFNAIISGSKKPPSGLSQRMIQRIQEAMRKKLEQAGRNLGTQVKNTKGGQRVKNPVTRTKTQVRNTKSGIDWKNLKNVTPRGGRTTRIRNTKGGQRRFIDPLNPMKTAIALPLMRPPKIELTGQEIVDPPPSKPKKGEFSGKHKGAGPAKKDIPIAVKRRTLKKKPSPIQSRKTRKGPIKKPDLSQLTGKFGVEGFSRTGSTMSDFLIGFTDGKGGKGRNYDKFMAKDSNGKYKVKTDTLKSMAKRLKEKMKK
jgi:hypothetical protein